MPLCQHSRSVWLTLGKSEEQTGTGQGRSTYKEKHRFESKRRLMETNTWKAAMSWSYTDESRTSIQRWEAAVLSSGWTCSGWVISCRCMAQRREPAVSSTQVRSERERERERLTITILNEIAGETRMTVTIRICVLEIPPGIIGSRNNT